MITSFLPNFFRMPVFLLAGLIVVVGTGSALAQSSSPTKPGARNFPQSKAPVKALTPAEKRAIEDIVHVIDTGKANITDYDERTVVQDILIQG